MGLHFVVLLMTMHYCTVLGLIRQTVMLYNIYGLCSFLPVLALNETSIKVKVQHKGDIHAGVCPLNCPEHNHKVCGCFHFVICIITSHTIELQCCPQLLVSKGKQTRTEIIGPDNIYQHLQQLNKEARRAQSTVGMVFIMLIELPWPHCYLCLLLAVL